MHEDHRKRVRSCFLESGLDGFPPHNALEFLLFYAIPRRDTNEIAHRLIEHFGSFSAVLEASYEELIQVDGIGENAATLLTLIPEISKYYMQDKAKQPQSFTNREQLQAYLITRFCNVREETVFLLSLDNAMQLKHCSEVTRGTKSDVPLDGRLLLETAFRHNATRVILAHNHPSGLAAPSREDVQLTKDAANLFRQVGIPLLDHVIVAGTDCFFMAENPKFSQYFI